MNNHDLESVVFETIQGNMKSQWFIGFRESMALGGMFKGFNEYDGRADEKLGRFFSRTW